MEEIKSLGRDYRIVKSFDIYTIEFRIVEYVLGGNNVKSKWIELSKSKDLKKLVGIYKTKIPATPKKVREKLIEDINNYLKEELKWK